MLENEPVSDFKTTDLFLQYVPEDSEEKKVPKDENPSLLIKIDRNGVLVKGVEIGDKQRDSDRLEPNISCKIPNDTEQQE